MLVKVKFLNGKVIPLEVSADDNVIVVKKMIEVEAGFEPAMQRLIFMGQMLLDDKKLSDVNVSDGSVMHLVVGSSKPGDAKHEDNVQEEDGSTTAAAATTTSTVPADVAPEETAATPSAPTASAAQDQRDIPVAGKNMKNSEIVVTEGVALYVICVANQAPMHIDGSSDKLCSARFGDVRDEFSQWRLVPVEGKESTYYLLSVATSMPLHCDGGGDKLCSTRYGDVRDSHSQWKLDLVSADSNAYYLLNAATDMTLHLDGNGDKLISTRYGEVRDEYAQWTLEEVGVQ